MTTTVANQSMIIAPSSRLGEVKEYYFSTKLQEIAQMRAAGKPVLNLGIGSPDLPPAQEALEADYKRLLQDEFGIVFDRLFTLANMPIQRFGAVLLAQGRFDDYMTLLKNSYRRDNVQGVMCRGSSIM